MNKTDRKFTANDIALISLMVAIIEVCKFAFSALPNIELTSFWIIVFTLYFGRRIYIVIPVFILVECVVFGFGLWWIMYLYAWPLLAVVTRLFCKVNSSVYWAIISGIFGLLFGLMCSVPYLFIGSADGNIFSGFSMAFAWWVAGIPWDIIHGIANFVIMLVLFHPITSVMKKLNNIIR